MVFQGQRGSGDQAFWDNGKENGNYFNIIGYILGLYRDNGKENGNYNNGLDRVSIFSTPTLGSALVVLCTLESSGVLGSATAIKQYDLLSHFSRGFMLNHVPEAFNPHLWTLKSLVYLYVFLSHRILHRMARSPLTLIPKS